MAQRAPLADLDQDIPTALSRPRLRVRLRRLDAPSAIAPAAGTPTGTLVPFRGRIQSDPTLTAPGTAPAYGSTLDFDADSDFDSSSYSPGPGIGPETPPTAVRAAPVPSSPAFLPDPVSVGWDPPPPGPVSVGWDPPPPVGRVPPFESPPIVASPEARVVSSPLLQPLTLAVAPAAAREVAAPARSLRRPIVVLVVLAFASGMATTFGVETFSRQESALIARSPHVLEATAAKMRGQGGAAGKREAVPEAPLPRPRLRHRRRVAPVPVATPKSEVVAALPESEAATPTSTEISGEPPASDAP